MPKKSRRGRALLFPSRPHFDGVAGEAIRLIGRKDYDPFRGLERWFRPDRRRRKEERRAREEAAMKGGFPLDRSRIPVIDSPIGPGHVTNVNMAGYPDVNGVTVAWLIQSDGWVFDPAGVRKKGGDDGQASGDLPRL